MALGLVPAAIGNAVVDATGVRHRWLCRGLCWKSCLSDPIGQWEEKMNRASHIMMAMMVASASVNAFAANASAQTFVPVTEATLASPDPADWLMMNRTFDEQRFSPLNQINTSNVGQLRMAWSRGLPNGTQESTPIVYRGVMYLYAPGASIQAELANIARIDLIQWTET